MTNTYRIVSIDDSYHETGKVYVKLQVCGTGKTFDRPVSELYQKEWLEKLSREDVAHIAALYTAEHTHNLELINKFPRRHSTMRAGAWMISVLFTAFLILSNLAAFKLTAIGPFIFPAAMIFFPLTYVFDDILTEVYGFKISRRIIWLALAANFIVILGLWVTTYLPAAPHWNDQNAYQEIYQRTPRILFASSISYLCSEFINSIILAKLKILTAGKHLWFRAITSTSTAAFVDTIIFIHLAFIGKIPYQELWTVILTLYSFKLIYEICAIPLTYKLTNYLKRKDNIDYYDFKTKFNPFSLEV